MPLIVKWPGKIKAGSVTDRMTGFEDWLVTLHTLIEAKKPLPAQHDGFEQAQHLLGKCPWSGPRCTGSFPDMGDSKRFGQAGGKRSAKKCSVRKEPRSLEDRTLRFIQGPFREQ